MSKFRVGALVIAIQGGPVGTTSGLDTGEEVRAGDSGEIVAGPNDYWYMGAPTVYWKVQWRNGLRVWSAQPALLVIEPDGEPVTQEQGSEVNNGPRTRT
jgi:hypothetical protein